MKSWVIIAACAVSFSAVEAISSRHPSAEQATRAKPSTKPVKEIEVHIDGGPPAPISSDDLWNRADVIAEGIISAAEPIDDLFTAYEVRLLELYKADNRTTTRTATITVSRLGGVRDKGTHIEKRVDRGFPLFEQGEQYILFLEALENGRYTLDAEGAFLVRGNSLQPRGRSEVGRAYEANPELFRMLLRSKGGAR